MRVSSCLLLLLMFAAGCSSNETKSVDNVPRKIEHTYFSIGDTVPEFSFSYTVNSVTEESIPVREGNKWIVFDVSYHDKSNGREDGQNFAYFIGDFLLLDDEGYIYRSYERNQITLNKGNTRDYVLFSVPYSKNQFRLFSEFLWDDRDRFDERSRNVVNISL